jgi:hypothetical protein
MGVPTSATNGERAHEVHKGHVVALEREKRLYWIINPVTCFVPICKAIFRIIFEHVKCTIDYAGNLRDLVLKEMMKIIVECYMSEFECGIVTMGVTIDKAKLTECIYLALLQHGFL